MNKIDYTKPATKERFTIAAQGHPELFTAKTKRLKSKALKGFEFYVKMHDGKKKQRDIANIAQRKLNGLRGIGCYEKPDWIFWSSVRTAATICDAEEQLNADDREGMNHRQYLRNKIMLLSRAGLRPRNPKKA